MIRYPSLNCIKRTTLAAAVSLGLSGIALTAAGQVVASDLTNTSVDSLQLVCRDSSLLTVASDGGFIVPAVLANDSRVSTVQGISGSDSRGISGSDSRGISGSDSRGISGSDSRGISGSDSRGISGSDSRGISGSDSRSLVENASLAAVGPVERLETSEAGSVVTVLGQSFEANVDLIGCVDVGDYVIAGAGGSGELVTLMSVGSGYVPGSSEVWLRGAVTSAREDVGLLNIGSLEVDYTPHLANDSNFRPSIGTLVEISGTQPVPKGAVILGISGSDSR